MAQHPSEITIPNVMDARFRDLLEQLAALAPADDITDADIDREVQAVRRAAVESRTPRTPGTARTRGQRRITRP